MVTKVSDTVVDTQYEAQFKYQPFNTSGLSFGISAGVLYEHTSQSPVAFAEQTLALTDDAANYVLLNLDNDPATLEAVTALPTLNILMYTVVTVGGAITSITDHRWKTVNNRILVTPYWPTNESEYLFFRNVSNGAYFNSEIMVRGDLDDPSTLRMYQIAASDAVETPGGHDQSFNEWYSAGDYTMKRPGDAKYLVGIYGSDDRPFRAFERDASDATGYKWTWLGDVAVDAATDNASTPLGNLTYYGLEYNPVYDEIVCLAGSYEWVYDDNDDDTFSINIPSDSFSHVLGSKSGNGGSRRMEFSRDGETLYWMESVSGATGGLWVFDRQAPPTTPRYNRTQLVTWSGDYSGTPIIAVNDDDDQIVTIDRNFNNNPGTTYAAVTYSKSGGTWSEDEELTDTIPVGTDAGEISGYLTHVYMPERDHFIIAATTSASGSSALFHWYKSGGSWTQNTNVDETDFYPFVDGDDCVGLRPLVDDYWLIVFYDSGTSYRAFFAKWNGATDGTPFENIYEVSDWFRESGTGGPDAWSWSTLVSHDRDPGVEVQTVTNPMDAWFLKHDPYLFWTGDTIYEGMDNASGNGRVVTEQGNSSRFDTVTTTGATWKTAGPAANTYGFTAAADTQLRDTSADSASYMSEMGTWSMVIYFKTPASLPDALDDTTAMQYHRPLISYGANYFNGSQAGMIWGCKSDTSDLYFCWGWSDDNTAAGAFMDTVDSALSLNTWYCAVVVGYGDGREPKIYINGTDEAYTREGTITLPELRGFDSVTNSKSLYIARRSSSYDRPITGFQYAGFAIYDTALTEENAVLLATDAGLS